MPVAKPRNQSSRLRAIQLIRRLPEDSTWEDVMHELYVRQKIEAGLADVEAGRTHSHAAIRREFGLSA